MPKVPNIQPQTLLKAPTKTVNNTGKKQVSIFDSAAVQLSAEVIKGILAGTQGLKSPNILAVSDFLPAFISPQGQPSDSDINTGKVYENMTPAGKYLDISIQNRYLNSLSDNYTYGQLSQETRDILAAELANNKSAVNNEIKKIRDQLISATSLSRNAKRALVQNKDFYFSSPDISGLIQYLKLLSPVDVTSITSTKAYLQYLAILQAALLDGVVVNTDFDRNKDYPRPIQLALPSSYSIVSDSSNLTAAELVDILKQVPQLQVQGVTSKDVDVASLSTAVGAALKTTKEYDLFSTFDFISQELLYSFNTNKTLNYSVVQKITGITSAGNALTRQPESQLDSLAYATDAITSRKVLLFEENEITYRSEKFEPGTYYAVDSIFDTVTQNGLNPDVIARFNKYLKDLDDAIKSVDLLLKLEDTSRLDARYDGYYKDPIKKVFDTLFDGSSPSGVSFTQGQTKESSLAVFRMASKDTNVKSLLFSLLLLAAQGETGELFDRCWQALLLHIKRSTGVEDKTSIALSNLNLFSPDNQTLDGVDGLSTACTAANLAAYLALNPSAGFQYGLPESDPGTINYNILYRPYTGKHRYPSTAEGVKRSGINGLVAEQLSVYQINDNPLDALVTNCPAYIADFIDDMPRITMINMAYQLGSGLWANAIYSQVTPKDLLKYLQPDGVLIDTVKGNLGDGIYYFYFDKNAFLSSENVGKIVNVMRDLQQVCNQTTVKSRSKYRGMTDLQVYVFFFDLICKCYSAYSSYINGYVDVKQSFTGPNAAIQGLVPFMLTYKQDLPDADLTKRFSPSGLLSSKAQKSTTANEAVPQVMLTNLRDNLQKISSALNDFSSNLFGVDNIFTSLLPPPPARQFMDTSVLPNFFKDPQIELLLTRIDDTVDTINASSDFQALDPGRLNTSARNLLYRFLGRHSSDNVSKNIDAGYSILSIGLPINFLRSTSIDLSQDSKVEQLQPKRKSVVKVIVVKKDELAQEVVWLPKAYLFDASLHHSIDYKKLVEPPAFSTTINKGSGYLGEVTGIPFRDYESGPGVYYQLPDALSYSFLSAVEKDELLANHFNSYMLDLYVQSYTGFCFNEQSIVDTTTLRQVSDIKDVSTSKQALLADPLASSPESADRLQRMSMANSNVMDSVALKKYLLSPRMFDRVFHVILDPNDFKIDDVATPPDVLTKYRLANTSNNWAFGNNKFAAPSVVQFQAFVVPYYAV